LTLIEQIRGAARDNNSGEAAVAIAAYGHGRADVTFLMEAVGLGGDIRYRWDCARVAATAIRYGRLGQEFSSATLRIRLPARAHRMIPRAIANLTIGGLAEQVSVRALSAAPGARGRKVPVYRLTRAGEALAVEIAPMPGVGNRVLESTLI
jgi:hypothetical protein